MYVREHERERKREREDKPLPRSHLSCPPEEEEPGVDLFLSLPRRDPFSLFFGPITKEDGLVVGERGRRGEREPDLLPGVRGI